MVDRRTIDQLVAAARRDDKQAEIADTDICGARVSGKAYFLTIFSECISDGEKCEMCGALLWEYGTEFCAGRTPRSELVRGHTYGTDKIANLQRGHLCGTNFI